MMLNVYNKNVQGYETGGTTAMTFLFFQKKRVPKIAYNSEPGSHQHIGKPNGFPRSALLCQEADF